MLKKKRLAPGLMLVGLCGWLMSAGCIRLGDADDVLDEVEDILDELDPRVIIVEDDDTFDDLDFADDVVVFGFENLTGFDIVIDYEVNGLFESILVFDGELLLVEYDCVDSFELLFESDYDPETGLLVDSAELADSLFVNPDDFTCDEALIVTFDVDEIFTTLEPLD